MMQQIQQEMEALRKALEASPKDAGLLTRMGNLYYDAGMFDKARDYYTKSWRSIRRTPTSSPTSASAFHRLARPTRPSVAFAPPWPSIPGTGSPG